MSFDRNPDHSPSSYRPIHHYFDDEAEAYEDEPYLLDEGLTELLEMDYYDRSHQSNREEQPISDLGNELESDNFLTKLHEEEYQAEPEEGEENGTL